MRVLRTQFLFIYIKFPEGEPFRRQIRLPKINCASLFTSSDSFLLDTRVLLKKTILSVFLHTQFLLHKISRR